MTYAKKVFFLFLYSLIVVPFIGDAQQMSAQRQKTGFNAGWSFSKDEKQWAPVVVPHTWNIADVMDDEPGYYRGYGWYRKTFIAGAELKNSKISLSFDGVNQEAEIFVNGIRAGSHAGGYTGFNISITDLLKFGGQFKNEILVRVTNRFNADIAPLTADFTFYGGIYRNINLLVTAPVHFYGEDYGAGGVYISTPRVSAARAEIRLKGVLENSSAGKRKLGLKTVIYDPEGQVVSSLISSVNLKAAEKKTILQNLPELLKPKLWSPSNPELYRVVTQILDSRTNVVLDEVVNPLGIRWFRFDADKGFFLNGKALKLIGASRHQDYEGLGNAVPEALQIRDVELLKEMGGNFLRVAHYPQDPVILQTCDRLGILASVEIPVVNSITETAEFTKNCENMQIEMIRQNFNHPSVIIWAYMNEILLKPQFNDDKARQKIYFDHVRALAQSLDNLTRAEDPSRYTMLACHGDFNRYNQVGLTKIPMVLGWNLYQGWYGGDLNGFADFLDKHHRELPGMPLLVTEYGADADPRIRSFSPVRFDKSVEYALKFHQVYLNAILERPFVSGAMAWNLADFNSETRDETMPHINNKGLLTFDRKPKDTYYLYQAYLSDKPFIKIAADWKERSGVADSGRVFSGQMIQVATNLDNAELFLNGKSLGVKTAKDHLCEWQVPFTNGANQLLAVNPSNPVLADRIDIRFSLIPYVFDPVQAFRPLRILLGASRYFIDDENSLWIPDQPYRKGAWGFIGGQPYKVSNGRTAYGTDKNIRNTANDPIYQTQQVDLKQYKLDVPDGVYEVTLYFAELIGGEKKEALAYNLDNRQVKEQEEQRVFNLKINEAMYPETINLAADNGYATAVQKKIQVIVTNGKGIVIDLIPLKGKPVLNALKIIQTSF